MMLVSFRTASLLQQRWHAISAATSRAHQRATFQSCSARAPRTRSGAPITSLKLNLVEGANIALPLQRTVMGRPLLQMMGSCNTASSIKINVAAPFRVRSFTTVMPEEDVKKRLDEFQELFVEARYCIEDCNDAAESTYFDEEAKSAKEAVEAAVAAFDSLIGDISDADQKNGILRSNGLKVEQLKGELQMALNGGHH